MLRRNINILKTNSFFLFGARGVGKTSLLNLILNEKTDNILKYDLLDIETFEKLSLNPNLIKEEILYNKKIDWVVVDEVQKIPKLLDLVHQLIESEKIKFALSGSSARKLKRGGANLLAGRAFTYNLFPFTAFEIGNNFLLQSALEFGTLPFVVNSSDDDSKKMYLKTYTHTYIKEEIIVEQVIRKIDPFRKFLSIAAQNNGEIINYANISKDCLCSEVTVKNYYQILEDTLIGFFLEPYHTSIRKRQKLSPKFYLFDLGVTRSLSNSLNIPLIPKTFEYGKAFEHFIICEVTRHISYLNNDFQVSYLRTKDNAEIDLIIERPAMPTCLIEIKSTTQVKESDLRHLVSLGKDFKNSESYCFSLDQTPRVINGVKILPWQIGLKEIGLG